MQNVHSALAKGTTITKSMYEMSRVIGAEGSNYLLWGYIYSSRKKTYICVGPMKKELEQRPKITIILL
jgi:hypothetical protein